MKKEFPIKDEWLPFEIHPDTPGKGVLWKDYFPGMDPMAFWQKLNTRAESMGIRFGPQTLMSNSSKAMQAGEFAKIHGRYEAFHDAVFKAYFTDCKDIGDTRVLLDIAQRIGLDSDLLEAELAKSTYIQILEETTKSARMNMISSAPTFVIERYGNVVGAEPIENFRKIFKTLTLKEVQA